MRAVRVPDYGIESLIIDSKVPLPVPAAGQVLIEVYAASINPFDLFVISGMGKEKMQLNLPITLGGDFAGVVTKLGEGVTELATGDQVYGTALILTGGSGAFAEYAVANVKNVARMPNISYTEAASLPLVGASAIQALVDSIQLHSKQKILIHGGAGGIGTVAIQLAKSIGAYVATTVSSRDFEQVRSLGADEVIDYQAEKFEEKLHGYDAVYDTVGGDVLDRSFAVLRSGGVIASMKGAPDPEKANAMGVKGVAVTTKTNTDRLNRLRVAVENGSIRPHVDRVFPLERIKDACLYLTDGHPRGKVVVSVKY